MFARAFAALALCLTSTALAGQDTEPAPDPTIGAIEQRIAEIEGLSEPPEETNAKTLAAYREALGLLREVEDRDAAALTYSAGTASAPADLQAAKDRLSGFVHPEPPPNGADLETLARGLAVVEGIQAEAQREVKELEAEIARRLTRRTEIPSRQAEVGRELGELVRQIAVPLREGLDPRLADATRTLQFARRRALERETSVLELESDHYRATQELLQVRLELAGLRAAAAARASETVHSRLDAMRVEEARRQEQTAVQAVEQAQGQHPLLQRIAEQNALLAQKRTQLASDLEAANAQLAQVTAELAVLSADFERTRDRVTNVGKTEAVGELLRQRRAQISGGRWRVPDLTLSREERRADARLQLYDLEDRRRELQDPGLVQRLLEEFEPPITAAAERQALGAAARDLLIAQSRIVNELYRELDGYHVTLVNIDSVGHDLERMSDRYLDYVKEHVLWIPSAVPLWRMDQRDWFGAARWLVSPANWAQVWAVTLEGLASRPGTLALALLAVLLLVLRPLLRRKIRADGEQAARGTNVSYTPTARVLLASMAAAAPFPSLLWAWSISLAETAPSQTLAAALSVGLAGGAVLLALFALIEQMVRRGGLGEVHFRWNPHSLGLLRRHVFWLARIAVPVAVAVGALQAQAQTPWIGSLGRTVLMLGLGSLFVFTLLTLHPHRGILGPFDASSGWLVRLRRLWFVLGCGTPAALFLLAFFGYGFTALQLVQRMELTLALLAVSFLGQALVLRALFLSQRKLAMERIRQKRAKAAREAKEEPNARSDTESLPEETPPVDTLTIAAQTRQLLRMTFALVLVLGVWAIWVDVLPALGILKQIVIWGDEAAGEPVVNLANLLLALIITMATFLAARNIPGVLYLMVLRRLEIQEGERLAVTTLVKYCVVAIGVTLAFSTIGIGWSKVQWLVAAMSVGLGFGLQEVFANFVSGLILLFERPIRVGDVVTVDDIMGRVSKMRIRATTIVDWDRREMVVPNREFVTGRFINWTLSDPITRITIPVGIAYGSDTTKAHELLLEIARECPLVMEVPKARAVFRRFGESSLDFELRVFIKDVDEWPRLIHELHMGIDRAFRAGGIEIAFPQRDLHLRSAPALVEYLGDRSVQPQPVPMDR